MTTSRICRCSRRALTSAQYEVVTAEDGPTALELIGKAAPDLVLLDVMMPGMSGYEVCQRIRANEATCLLPVVMLTALTDVADRIRGIEAGADDFLSKPVNREELLTRVKSLLGSRRSTTTSRPRTICSAISLAGTFLPMWRPRSSPIPGVT